MKSFIFDFDGVIADTDQLHLDAWNAAHLALFGAPIDRLIRFSGRHSQTIASILAKESGYRARATDLIRTKQQLLIEKDLTCVPIMGVLDFIKQVELKGIKWGVASNSNAQFVKSIIIKFGLKPVIVVTPIDVIKPKPAPDLFWHCANLMGILPADRSKVIVFEDSPHGIAAAKAAGMRPFGIGTNCEPATLERAGAEKTVQNFTELDQNPNSLFT